MKLCWRVSREEVFRLTFEECKDVAAARVRNKGWKESKIRWAEQLEELTYKIILAPIPKSIGLRHIDRFLLAREKFLASELLRTLEFTIQAKAQAQERKWIRKIGLTANDFASIFREEVFRFTKAGGDWPHGEFYIIETLEMRWERRAVELLRKETTKQRQWERNMGRIDAAGMEQADERTNVEEEAIYRALLDDPAFTEEERRVFHAVYRDSKASNRELAETLCYPHPETVRRIKKRIRNKLVG